MKVLILHNQLWAHYKTIIFNELEILAKQNPNLQVKVLQTATIERSRLGFGELNLEEHQYDYELIQDGVVEGVSNFKKIKKTISVINNFKPDVVNFTGYHELATIFILLFCKLKGIKTILSNESTILDQKREKIKESIKSLIIRQFDGFFNFGSLSKQYMISLGASEDKMLVNKNCVDNQKIRSNFETALPKREETKVHLGLASKNFIFVGRLIQAKNLDKLLDAFHQIGHPEKENWGLILLGEGILKEELIYKVEHEKIDNVKFIAGQTWEKVPEILALADVFVLPSVIEPWGLVINEAMVCGKPILVSNQCGCVSDLLVDETNGYLLNPHNVNDIADKMTKVMSMSTLALEKMGEKSLEIIKNYTPELVASEMLKGYQKVCLPKK
jgi:glycosyltransferase involved in cell wall biosynthesis